MGEQGEGNEGDRERLPRYRLLTGPDDDAFCRRVSEALDLGYVLYGSPAICGFGDRTVAAQAIVWAGIGQPPLAGTLLPQR